MIIMTVNDDFNVARREAIFCFFLGTLFCKFMSEIFKQHKFSHTFDGKKINKSQFGDELNGDPFRIGNASFCIRLSPKGRSQKRKVAVYFGYEAESLNISYMLIAFRITVPSLGVTVYKRDKLGNGEYRGWTNMHESSKLLNIKELKVNATFTILRIWNDENNMIRTNLWNKCFNAYDYDNNDNINDNDSKYNEPSLKEINSKMNLLENEMNSLKKLVMKEINDIKKQLNKTDKNMNHNDNNPVLLFLKSIKLSEYYDDFMEQGFDSLDDIEMITRDDLKNMNIIKIAHQRRILNGIKKYNNNNNNNNNGETDSF